MTLEMIDFNRMPFNIVNFKLNFHKNISFNKGSQDGQKEILIYQFIKIYIFSRGQESVCDSTY